MNEIRYRCYLIEVDGNHCVIRREDDLPVNPTFYEMYAIKNMAFGNEATAIEVFPSTSNLVDSQNQRHLWSMEDDAVPNLKTGFMVHYKGE